MPPADASINGQMAGRNEALQGGPDGPFRQGRHALQRGHSRPCLARVPVRKVGQGEGHQLVCRARNERPENGVDVVDSHGQQQKKTAGHQVCRGFLGSLPRYSQ